MKYRVRVVTTHDVVVDEPDEDTATDHAYDVVRDGNAGFGDTRVISVTAVAQPVEEATR